MIHDRSGHAISGATVEGLVLSETTRGQLHCHIGSPLQSAEAAIAASPDFAMSHLIDFHRGSMCSRPARAASAFGNSMVVHNRRHLVRHHLAPRAACRPALKRYADMPLRT
jgi:hypothetical protein